MGPLAKRKEKVAESAAEYLEPDESIRAMVMTQVGETADELATKVAAHGACERSVAAGHLPQAGKDARELVDYVEGNR